MAFRYGLRILWHESVSVWGYLMTTNGRKRRLGMSPEGRRILQMRNEEIFHQWNEMGKSYGTLALEFNLTRSAIQKIVEQQRKGKAQ